MITGLSLPNPPADARRPPSAWPRRRSSTSFSPVEAPTNWPRFNFEKMDAPVRTSRASGGAARRP
jgi:hypothetical protein